MTKWSTRKRLGHGWLLAVLSLAPPVYFGAPSNAGFLVASFERQAAPPLTQQEVAQQLADLAASRQIFKLTPGAARQKLSGLAKLEDGLQTNELRQLIGVNISSGIQWIDVQFQPADTGGGKTSWQFLQAEFGLARTDGNSDQLYQSFKAILTKRLAKLGRQEKETPDKGVAWRLKPFDEVRLRKGDFLNPLTKRKQQVVLLKMSVLQGEAEK